jgi:radical SAM protein with 4Fe4S-binding SPASM domain
VITLKSPPIRMRLNVRRVPDLPNGPLPHLADLLSGRVPDDDPAALAAAATPAPAEPGADAPPAEGPATHLSREELARQVVTKFALPAAEPEFQAGAEGGRARYTCKFLWNELFVNVSGDVAPCCIQGRPVVGNVHQESLAEIWNNEPMREMREKLLIGDPIPCCKDCNYNTQLGQGTYREDTFFVKLDRKV